MSESESEFPNDSEDERAGKEEEESTLAARDSWIGLANSTSHHLKVATFTEYVREKQSGGKDAIILKSDCALVILKLPLWKNSLTATPLRKF